MFNPTSKKIQNKTVTLFPIRLAKTKKADNVLSLRESEKTETLIFFANSVIGIKNQYNSLQFSSFASFTIPSKIFIAYSQRSVLGNRNTVSSSRTLIILILLFNLGFILEIRCHWGFKRGIKIAGFHFKIIFTDAWRIRDKNGNEETLTIQVRANSVIEFKHCQWDGQTQMEIDLAEQHRYRQAKEKTHILLLDFISKTLS